MRGGARGKYDLLCDCNCQHALGAEITAVKGNWEVSPCEQDLQSPKAAINPSSEP